MFDALIGFFETFISMFTSLFNMAISLFSDIAYVVQLTGKFVVNVPNYFGWLPSECTVIITLIFSIVVLYKILGREG